MDVKPTRKPSEPIDPFKGLNDKVDNSQNKNAGITARASRDNPLSKIFRNDQEVRESHAPSSVAGSMQYIGAEIVSAREPQSSLNESSAIMRPKKKKKKKAKKRNMSESIPMEDSRMQDE